MPKMYYPAAGVMPATLLVKKEDKLVPKKFYLCFITITVLLPPLTVGAAFLPATGMLFAGLNNDYHLWLSWFRGFFFLQRRRKIGKHMD